MTVRSGSSARVALVWRNDVLHGSETFIRNQVDATRGWRAVLAGVRRRDSALSDDSDEILFGSTRVERLRRRVFLTTGRSRRLDRLIRGKDVSLIHAHFATSAATIARTARRHGLPLVVTVHGFDVTNHELWRGRRGARNARHAGRALQEASRVVAVSEFIAQQTVSAFGVDPDRIRVLPIGIPLRSGPEVKKPIRDLVFVGRLVEKKGLADLLRALSRLIDRGLTPTLAVVGEGPLRVALEDSARALGLTVDFLGALPPSAVAQVMAESRILVAPSRTARSGDSEGFGMVHLEAALAGIPAIAYRHGGVPEAVIDGVTGLLVDEGDVEGLALSIDRLLSDTEQRVQMGRAAAARVRADFDIVRCTDRLVALYEEVAADATGHPLSGSRGEKG